MEPVKVEQFTGESTVMPQRRKNKYFRDPIHGFIEVSQVALSIVNHPLFQRLRRIKQLGLAEYVFHGATHTRFEHSLGVMKIAEDILRFTNVGLTRNKASDGSITNNFESQKIILAALLHDIGHFPLSHTFEKKMKEKLKLEGHEVYSKAIIERTSIKDILTDNSFSNNDIQDIVTYILGHHVQPFPVQIIHSELDADRLDYLLRDSLYCGVKYGIYDLDRLLISLDRYNDQLIVTARGRHAVEEFIFARFYMYRQVYIHKTKRAFEILANKVVERLIDKGLISYPSPNDNLEEKLVYLDDIWLFSKLRCLYRLNEIDDYTKMLIGMLLFRRPIKLVKELEEYTDKEDPRFSKEFTKLEQIIEYKKFIDALKEESISPEEHIFIDGPAIEVKQTPYYTSPEKEDEEKSHTIYILDRDETLKDIAEIKESIIKEIVAKKLWVIRVYTLDEYRPIVEKMIKKFL